MTFRIASCAASIALLASPTVAPAVASKGATSVRVAAPVAGTLLRDSFAGRTIVGDGSARILPWTAGTIYKLKSAPGFVADIALQPGENLVSVAAGDTARWIIGDTSSGSGPTRSTHILVKASAAGLRTNLVISTDRRVYRLLIESNAGAPPEALSWTYPEDALLALRRTADAKVAEEIAVDRLNFNYSISGDRPAWRPLRAFDDGARVFIEFPPTLGSAEAPPLFVIGADGRAELVNYRLRGQYYVVERLFSLAELRLGGKRQQMVRIGRVGGVKERR